MYFQIIATSIMISDLKIMARGSSSILLTWKLRHMYSPSEYRLTVQCKLQSNGTNRIYLTKQMTIPSSQLECIINPVQQESTCSLEFFAVYNKASLDPGVVFSFATTRDCESSQHFIHCPYSQRAQLQSV